MFNGVSDLLPKPEEQLFSGHLIKQRSLSNLSVRTYHGGLPGSVPFMWESQPGTPKHLLCDTVLPPLTPPPSFSSKSARKPGKERSRCSLFLTLLPKFRHGKAAVSELPQTSHHQIEQDERMLWRLLAKEREEAAKTSLLLCHGGLNPGAIPFTCESQPQTPRHPVCERIISPLTPPPSYYFNRTAKRRKSKYTSLFDTLLLKCSNGGPKAPKKPGKTKQDNNIFSRILTKESSMTNPSVRVYHGGLPGSVPFTWESQPGTPKNPLSESATPPLIPPPSYYHQSSHNQSKNQPRYNLLQKLFPKFNLKKTSGTALSPPCSSSSSFRSPSNFSSLYPPFMTTRRNRPWIYSSGNLVF